MNVRPVFSLQAILELSKPGSMRYSHPQSLVSTGCESACVCSNRLADLGGGRSNEIRAADEAPHPSSSDVSRPGGGLDRQGYETTLLLFVPDDLKRTKGEDSEVREEKNKRTNERTQEGRDGL